MLRGVDLETLLSLLGQGAAAPELAYVSTWHADKRRELIDLAADVGAMESLPSGGHIIVGANDWGKPSGRFHPIDTANYVEPRVRSALADVLEPPIGVRSALHKVEGHFFLLVAVDRHPDGFRIMARDGQYGSTTVWRRGDVLVRPLHPPNAVTKRWDQREARALLDRIVIERVERHLLHDSPDLLPRSSSMPPAPTV